MPGVTYTPHAPTGRSVLIRSARPPRRAPLTVHLGGRFSISGRTVNWSSTVSNHTDRRHRRRRHRPRGHRRGPQGRRRRRRRRRVDRLRPRRAPLPARTAPSCPTRCWRSGAASTPSCSAPSAIRPPGVAAPPGLVERGILLRMRFDLDQYINLRPFRLPPTHRLRGHPREHRGHLRRRGRVPAQGHPARDRHAGLGQHPHGRRAVHPLRLREGGRTPSASTSRWCTRRTC